MSEESDRFLLETIRLGDSLDYDTMKAIKWQTQILNAKTFRDMVRNDQIQELVFLELIERAVNTLYGKNKDYAGVQTILERTWTTCSTTVI